MNWQILIIQFSLILIAGLLFFLSAAVWQHREKRAADSLALLLFLLSLWVVGYGRELAYQGLEPILFWVRLEYVAIVLAPVVWLYFVLQYTGCVVQARWRFTALVLLIPLISLVGMWTNDLHHLFYQQVFLKQEGLFTLLRPDYGPLFWLDVVYSYALLGAGMVVILRVWLNSRGLQRQRMALIFAGALVPVLVNLLTLLRVEFPFHLHWTAIAFGLTGVLTYWAVWNMRLLDLAPIAQDRVLEHMKVALFVLDAERQVVDLNLAACSLAGVDYQGGYGKTLVELMPGVADWPRILSGEQNQAAEAVFIYDRSARTYEIRVAPLTDRRGNHVGQSMVMMDITQRKLSERRLWESNELLERMFSNLHYLVVFMGPDYKYIKVNHAFARFFDMNPEEMVGLDHFQFLANEELRKILQNVLETGTPYTAEGRPFSPRDSQDVLSYWDWSAQAVHDENGRVNSLVLTMMDVTRREQAARALSESEQKYRIIAENTYDWEFWLGPDGEFLYVSPACQRISGYAPEEFQHNPRLMDSIVIPEDLQVRQAHKKIATLDRKPDEIQFRIRHKDGRIIWLAHSCQPIFTGEGVFLGNRGNNHDVTEYHLAEEAIARTAAIVQTTDDAIYSIDLDNLLLSWNPAAERMYGYRAVEVLGKKVDLLIPADRDGEADAIQARLLRGDSITHMETVRRRKDGTVFPVSLTFSPIPDEHGEFTQASVIARDISQQKRAQEAIRRRALELEALYETSLELNGEKDPHVLLSAITRRVTGLVDAPMASIFLLNEDKTELEMVTKYNLPRNLNHLRIKVGDGVTGLVAASGKPVNVADYQEDEKWRLRPNLFGARRFLSVPMIWNGEVIGVIDIGDGQRTGAFSVDHVHLVSLFANQAAIALRNAREVDRLWQQATTDNLTGLDNRRHFMEMAQAAWDRAFRKKLPLAILMIDIDHFKLVNDRWGHQLGDSVLIQVAETCRNSLRNGDIIGRYGGEEFIALLPAIQLEQALKIASRLVSAVSERPFTVADEDCHISISIGVSALDPGLEMFPTLDEMILQADRALYKAKQSGRNQAHAYASNLAPTTTLTN
jgi:diguanylate cyclase (GGDEF)-like protein/PAS domain S-box-containing protein